MNTQAIFRPVLRMGQAIVAGLMTRNFTGVRLVTPHSLFTIVIIVKILIAAKNKAKHSFQTLRELLIVSPSPLEKQALKDDLTPWRLTHPTACFEPAATENVISNLERVEFGVCSIWNKGGFAYWFPEPPPVLLEGNSRFRCFVVGFANPGDIRQKLLALLP
jgi:hypothetical protein